VRPNIAPPIVIELGKLRSADIEKPQEGDGRVAEDIKETMRLINLRVGPNRTNRVFVPVVVLYSRPYQK
jgi:hypothetical protein